jgi:pyruvate/2-oxoglutarate dehydrogenase complex dihydrolipoamide dehydrogenase (E3) component
MTGPLYDLAIIGGGSAGLTAARYGVALGANVALIDRAPEALGGECLHTGCVPSKALIHAARAHWRAGHTAEYGLPARDAAGPVDLGRVLDQVRAVQARAGKPDTPAALGALDIALYFGQAVFHSPALLTVAGEPVRARRYVIATGSRPALPDIAGLARVDYLTNETIFTLRTLPATLLVIGGGPVGCELGQAFARLGARVTIAGRADRLLPKEDPAASAVLARVFAHEDIAVLTGATVTSLQRDGEEIVATVRQDECDRTTHAAAVLVATGRRVDVAGLDLDAAGVAVGRDGVVVDEHARTTNPAIYACGDAIGQLRFTHAAGYQAAVAVRNALLPVRAKLDYRAIPWATFTSPEVGHVGLTEAEAHARHQGVQMARLPFTHVDRALTMHAADAGFIAIVHDPKGTILGAQIVGPEASELIDEIAVAMKQGLRLGDLASTIHVYPTLGMGIQQAALAWRARSPAARRLRAVLRPLFRWQRRRVAASFDT